MTPIGIVTYNRAEFLDITLRSLSATRLSDDQIVIVFDDTSDDPRTLKYLYSSDIVDLSRKWPSSKQWYDIGLGIVKSRNNAIGLKNTVSVIRLNDNRQKVVNASCDALRRLYKMFPKADSIILLQDDLVFNVDWLDRLTDASKMKVDPPIGAIAGMHMGGSRDPDRMMLNRSQLTAQCYLITSLGKKIISNWINEHSASVKGFDGWLCKVVREKAGVYLINPPVCQHIGIISKVWVDPKEKRIDFANFKWRRIDSNSRGPYVIASDVKNFISKVTK